MKANKKAQRNRNQFFSDKQRKEKAKSAALFESTCQFNYELEELVNDSLLWRVRK